MRFVVDCMLGSLAKWLKILGHDVLYDSSYDDDTLVRIAKGERRTLVTRDSRLVLRRAVREPIFIKSQNLPDQILQVLREKRLRIEPRRLLSRCLECNLPTDPLPRDTVREKVPPYVFRTQKRFSRCPRCGKIFWKATHVDRMLARLRDEFQLPPEKDH